ncbi:entericidin A/B family lipoprotein [Acetobacter estunensis]|uniref:entericidin A/B family lipoprotein n=1 Tax=Acetobacter estunensis TaxID=104097 RepID=UPI0020C1C31D|nr:entericidin A/B family lipoprotein [Acetobacter estunensis]
MGNGSGMRGIKRVAGAMLASAMMLGLAGCNTVAGAGRDVSSVGHNVSRGATATQQGISNATGSSTH